MGLTSACVSESSHHTGMGSWVILPGKRQKLLIVGKVENDKDSKESAEGEKALHLIFCMRPDKPSADQGRP